MIDLPQCKFHHIGVATRSIEKEIEYFNLLGYRQETDFFEDKNQGVRGVFLTGDGPRLELLENLEDSKVLNFWLDNKVKFYHTAYITPDLKLIIDYCKSKSGKIIRKPMMSEYFKTEIAFIIFRNNLLIELIQEGTHV